MNKPLHASEEHHVRCREHVECALAHTRFDRISRLVEIAMKCSPEDPAVLALRGHLAPNAAVAMHLYTKALARPRHAMSDGAASALALASAAKSYMSGDADAAVAGVSRWWDVFPAALRIPAVRLWMTASTASDDMASLRRALRQAQGSDLTEWRWFAFFHAVATGSDEVPTLARAALNSDPGLLGRVLKVPVNPCAMVAKGSPAHDAVARGTVAVGLAHVAGALEYL